MNDLPPTEIPLTKVISVSNPGDYKLHAARRNENGDQPLDVFMKSYAEWRKWNTYQKTRNDFNKGYIFSMIDVYREQNIWLFGGIFKVISRGANNSHSYEIEEQSEYLCYVGRLKIKFDINADGRTRGRAFKLKKRLNQMVVSEIIKL